MAGQQYLDAPPDPSLYDMLTGGYRRLGGIATGASALGRLLSEEGKYPPLPPAPESYGRNLEFRAPLPPIDPATSALADRVRRGMDVGMDAPTVSQAAERAPGRYDYPLGQAPNVSTPDMGSGNLAGPVDPLIPVPMSHLSRLLASQAGAPSQLPPAMGRTEAKIAEDVAAGTPEERALHEQDEAPLPLGPEDLGLDVPPPPPPPSPQASALGPAPDVSTPDMGAGTLSMGPASAADPEELRKYHLGQVLADMHQQEANFARGVDQRSVAGDLRQQDADFARGVDQRIAATPPTGLESATNPEDLRQYQLEQVRANMRQQEADLSGGLDQRIAAQDPNAERYQRQADWAARAPDASVAPTVNDSVPMDTQGFGWGPRLSAWLSQGLEQARSDPGLTRTPEQIMAQQAASAPLTPPAGQPSGAGTEDSAAPSAPLPPPGYGMPEGAAPPSNYKGAESQFTPEELRAGLSRSKAYQTVQQAAARASPEVGRALGGEGGGGGTTAREKGGGQPSGVGSVLSAGPKQQSDDSALHASLLALGLSMLLRPSWSVTDSLYGGVQSMADTTANYAAQREAERRSQEEAETHQASLGKTAAEIQKLGSETEYNKSIRGRTQGGGSPEDKIAMAFLQNDLKNERAKATGFNPVDEAKKVLIDASIRGNPNNVTLMEETPEQQFARQSAAYQKLQSSGVLSTTPRPTNVNPVQQAGAQGVAKVADVEKMSPALANQAKTSQTIWLHMRNLVKNNPAELATFEEKYPQPGAGKTQEQLVRMRK